MSIIKLNKRYFSLIFDAPMALLKDGKARAKNTVSLEYISNVTKGLGVMFTVCSCSFFSCSQC